MKFQSLREQCLEANRSLVDLGLVDMTFGNASVYCVEQKVFAIKPSGVEYDQLKLADIVVLDLDGNVIDGHLKPSSDTPTHRCLLLAFENQGIRSVVHTHSRSAVAFAQARRPLTCFGTTHADFFRGSIPVTREMTAEEINTDYEWETGKVIVEAFENLNPVDITAVLVQNHGPFTWGNSARAAVESALALEIVAEIAIKTLSIRSGTPAINNNLLDKHFLRKHGSDAYYGQRND